MDQRTKLLLYGMQLMFLGMFVVYVGIIVQNSGTGGRLFLLLGGGVGIVVGVLISTVGTFFE